MKKIIFIILIVTTTACTTTKYRGAAIRERLSETSGLAAHNISIDEQPAGNITLSGDVASIKDRDTIEEVARDTSGVENLRSNLVIEPSSVTVTEGYPSSSNNRIVLTPPHNSDFEINQRVLLELGRSRDIDLRNVEIITKDQIVTLRGVQNSKRDIDNLVYSTERVAGVRAVINELSLYNVGYSNHGR